MYSPPPPHQKAPYRRAPDAFSALAASMDSSEESAVTSYALNGTATTFAVSAARAGPRGSTTLAAMVAASPVKARDMAERRDTSSSLAHMAWCSVSMSVSAAVTAATSG